MVVLCAKEVVVLCARSGSALCEGESCSSQCEVDGLGLRRQLILSECQCTLSRWLPGVPGYSRDNVKLLPSSTTK